MSLFKTKVELIVIRDPSNPQSMEYYSGRNLEDLVKQAFKDGISDSVRFYHADLTKEVFGIDERKDKQSIKAFCGLKGRVYAQVVPMGLDPISWVIIGVSVAVSLAATFLLAPKMPDMGNQSQPPSPNNALAARTNSQRLGGRIPDIFGEVWSVPDLIAPTYSVYIDHKEVEYSYMCVGRGKHEVKRALDDTTPVSQVAGSGVLIYDPDTGLEDAPVKAFGEQFDPNEAEFARLAAKRYTSVNGQELIASNGYYQDIQASFEAPNIVRSEYLAARWKADDVLNIEGADSIPAILKEPTEENPEPEQRYYTLSGIYEVDSVVDDAIYLKAPDAVNSEWYEFALNDDKTETIAIGASTQEEVYWQGWFYTNDTSHDGAYINFSALNGIYWTTDKGKIYGQTVSLTIESEVVDVNGNPIAGTRHVQQDRIRSKTTGWGDIYEGGGYYWGQAISIDRYEQMARESVYKTVAIENPHFSKGDRLRVRVGRGAMIKRDKGQVVQDVKVKDFCSHRTMTASDYPSGVTTVYTKTLATEGALSIKERKLRLLVERYVTDYATKELKLSKRADDIIYHIATDPKNGNLTDEQIDFEQIRDEIDILVGYFGSEKFAEFCYTFDDNNLSSEEIIQTVARAVFSNAKRYGNKLMLDFEREVPASVAVFNSHNILPDSYAASESFGVINEYDGAKVEYADPVDDAQVTKSYPSDAVTNPHTEKLIGVRNELQATAHMMRLYNKDRFTYKSCEITAGDESNIVTRTNRITVASQTAVDVQQGTVEAVEVVGSDIVLHTSDPVNVSDGSYLFIQTINNGVESIACSPRDDYSVTLARLPQGEISTDWHNAVRAVYQIVGSNDGDKDAYIVTKKDPSEGMTNKLTCTNYSSKFYQNDKDYLNSI